MAKKESLPDFGVSVNYEQERFGGAGEKTFTGGATVKLPLFSNNRAGRREARNMFKKEKLRAELIRLELQSELPGLFTDYETAAAILDKFKFNDDATVEKQMKYADTEFRKGRFQYQTYLDLDHQSHELLKTVLDAQVRIVTIYTKILFLAGEDIKTGKEVVQ